MTERRIEIPPPTSTPTTGSPATPPSGGGRKGWKHADDAEVLAASLAGDQAAWSELVARYSRLVFSIPRRYGFDREACEDIFQEVFAIFVRQLPGIRRRSGLPKWFITTTHRVCQTWFRQTRTATESEALSPPQPPAELLVEWERQHLLRLAMRRLGGKCEQLLLALYCDNGPAGYKQIAEKLDMPAGSIGPARARCLQKLSDILETMEGRQ